MSITESFKHAIDGIVNATSKERNLKIHFSAMACVIAAGLIVGLSQMEWMVCIILCGLVISAELFNTAIEKAMDYISMDRHPEIGFVKDASAGAVLVLTVTSVIIGLMIFIPKLV
jgi:diacylglycerol kinase